MNSLFGLELPAPVNFVIAFVVVMALIGAATWAVRRFGGARMEAASRNRQPRLAVVDSAAVDGRRKLVIVRRDNVEHLLMIGGPTDVVVESSIVRGGAVAAREPALREPAARAASPDTLPRVMPLPDPTPWPLAPEPAARTEPVAHVPVVHVDEPVRSAPPAEPKPAVRAVPREPAPPVEDTSDAGDLSHTRPEPLASRAAAPAAQPSARAFAPAEPNPDDTNLAEMAQRLEAALRRPMPTPGEPRKPAAATPAPAKRAPEPRPAPRPQPRAVVGAAMARSTPAPAAAEPAPDAAAQAKTEFENLEQEMATLLGRSSSGKT